MIPKEQLQILSQLISSMADATAKLEQAYNARDLEELDRWKKTLADFQFRIESILK